jgi:hypothetical protein
VRKHFDTAASQADGEKQVVITRSTNIKRPPQLPAIILAAPIAAPTVSSLAPPLRQQNNSASWQVSSATNVPGCGKPAADDSPSSQEFGGNPVVEEREVQIDMDNLFDEKCEFIMTP